MAEFQPGSCVFVDQSSSRAKVGAVTVRLSPQLALPVSQRTDDPDEWGSQGPAGLPLITKAVRLQAPRAHAVLH